MRQNATLLQQIKGELQKNSYILDKSSFLCYNNFRNNEELIFAKAKIYISQKRRMNKERSETDELSQN